MKGFDFTMYNVVFALNRNLKLFLVVCSTGISITDNSRTSVHPLKKVDYVDRHSFES